MLVVGTATAITAVAALGDASAQPLSAPYPPTAPCVVSAAAAARDTPAAGTDFVVVGAGLGASTPVRVSLARTGQVLAAVTTAADGTFSTTVAAPDTASLEQAPTFRATSPTRTCTTPPHAPYPPTAPSTSPPPGPSGPSAPSAPSGGTGSGGAGSGSGVGPGSGPGGSGSGGAGAGGASGPGGGAGSGGSTGAGSGATSTTGTPGGAAGGTGGTGPGGSASSSPSTGTPRPTPPVAEPGTLSRLPAGVTLGIAALLLVLGTLLVLLLTRRSSH